MVIFGVASLGVRNDAVESGSRHLDDLQQLSKVPKPRQAWTRVLDAFCTAGLSTDNSFRMEGEFSEQLKNWILDHISSMSPDGATTAQHSARAIADDCEGCVLITMDLVHEPQGLFDAVGG